MHFLFYNETPIHAFFEGEKEWFRLADLRSVLDAQMAMLFNGYNVKHVDTMTFIDSVGVRQMLRALGEAGRDVTGFTEWFEEIVKRGGEE